MRIEVDDKAYDIEAGVGGVIGDAISTGEPYEAKVLYHIKRLGLKGTAVDVGAHIGNHTLWFAVMCGLRVYAFEPVEYEKLVANLQLNSLNGAHGAVSPHPVALGATEGKARLVSKGTLTTDSNGEVSVCRLDDFNLENVSLLKVDVEGMEPAVLEGGHRTIKQCRPRIFVEAKDRAAHRSIKGILRPLGYRHVQTYGATPLEEWVA